MASNTHCMKITYCRICKGSNLEKFLNLGVHPPSDAFLRRDQLDIEEKSYPVDACLCTDCGLVQLGYIVPPEEMFNKEYVYVTSISKTADNHFREYAKEVMERYGERGSFVVEMGSNDGTLLSHFRDFGAEVLGVDPSRAATMSIKRSVETINEFFCEDIAKSIRSKYGRAQIIAGANVFAHINDLDDILNGIEYLLDDDGIFVMEFPYLLELVRHIEFDTIYHEHLSYFSITPLVTLFERFSMEIFDITRTPVHGGSIRIYVKRQRSNRETTGKLKELLELEKKEKLFSLETFTDFASKVEKFREEFNSLLNKLKGEGALIAGNGAPAKGNTLLNYCQVGPDLIEFIAEINPLKHYMFTPGMHIPVLPLSSIKEKKPDYMVILPWNLKHDIIRQESAYRESGGKFIVPLPEPIIL